MVLQFSSSRNIALGLLHWDSDEEKSNMFPLDTELRLSMSARTLQSQAGGPEQKEQP